MEKVNNEKAADSKRRKSSVALNVVTVIVLALAVMLLVQGLYTNKNLHNNYFGYAILPVASESMDAGESPIKKGDLIFVKLIDKDKKQQLSDGEIVTFKYFIHELDSEQLITHRIQSKENGYYITHGDANPASSIESVGFDNVVGVYKGKIGGIGHIGLFFQTKAGSFVMIVAPFLVLLLLSMLQFLRNYRAYSREKVQSLHDEARSSILVEEKERLRLEILAELKKEKQAPENEIKMEQAQRLAAFKAEAFRHDPAEATQASPDETEKNTK